MEKIEKKEAEKELQEHKKIFTQMVDELNSIVFERGVPQERIYGLARKINDYGYGIKMLEDFIKDEYI